MSHIDAELGGQARRDANTSPEETAHVVTDRIAKKGLGKLLKTTNKLKRLAVEYVDIASIKPNTYNPNRQDEATLELLCRSILDDGFTTPVLVHQDSRQIVDGEHRWRAAKKLSMTQIPVVFVDMSDEQMKVATLRHNRARGSEDISLANDVIRDLQMLGALDWAQGSLMMSDAELNDLFDDLPASEALAGIDYEDAWIPERGHGSDNDLIEGDIEQNIRVVEMTDERNGGIEATAMTENAAIATFERKEALSRASSQSERARLSKEIKPPYKVSFSFRDDEADVVRKVLGETPGKKLMAICERRFKKEGMTLHKE